MDRWLTSREVALLIGMSSRYVQREAEAGRLRAREVGTTGSRTTLRYRLADVTAWQARYTRDRGPCDEADDA
jgi:phenylacetate-coenzyme A ligase PaaK-like adenylate-forming protein